MTMGTNDQPQPRSRKSIRDITIYGLGSVIFAMMGVLYLLDAYAWYVVLSGCIMLLAAAVWASRAIISLRIDHYVGPE